MPPWYGDTAPYIFCRHLDCNWAAKMTESTAPVCCPGCSRQTKDGGDWWTPQRPVGKPRKGTLSDKDTDFLRCQGIQPWEGGIDTE